MLCRIMLHCTLSCYIIFYQILWYLCCNYLIILWYHKMMMTSLWLIWRTWWVCRVIKYKHIQTHYLMIVTPIYISRFITSNYSRMESKETVASDTPCLHQALWKTSPCLFPLNRSCFLNESWSKWNITWTSDPDKNAIGAFLYSVEQIYESNWGLLLPNELINKL